MADAIQLTGVELVAQLNAKTKVLLEKSQEAAKAGDIEALKMAANEAAAIKKQIQAITKLDSEKAVEANKSLIDSMVETLRQSVIGFVKNQQTALDKLGALGIKVEVVRFEAEIGEGGITTFYVGTKATAHKSTKVKDPNAVSVEKTPKQVRLADGSIMEPKAFVVKYANDKEKAGKTFSKWPTNLTKKIAARIGAIVEEKPQA